jgi:3',5'-cyclic AMP phosphodiesterase CpdA
MSDENDVIKILHVSDFHYSTPMKTDDDVKAQRFSIDRVLKDFISCFTEKHTAYRPDIIAITGDIADTGDLNEYEEFHKTFLKPFLEELKLDIKNVILCPGNHDIVRKELKKEKEDISETNLNKIQAYKHIFEGYIEYQKRNKFEPLANSISDGNVNYDFLNRLSGYRKIQGIHFLSLNSAWYCRDEDWNSENSEKKHLDFGKLSHGQLLIEDAISNLYKNLSDFGQLSHGQLLIEDAIDSYKSLNCSSTDYVVMLSHHPFFFDTTVGNGDGEESLPDKERRYVSNQYQWLKSDEVFGNKADSNKREGNSFMKFLEEYVNLVLCGQYAQKNSANSYREMA